MTERFSGVERKWDFQRMRETARVFGWAVAVGMIAGGVVLKKPWLVKAGMVAGLMDAVIDVSIDIVGGIGKGIKNDLFGSPAKV